MPADPLPSPLTIARFVVEADAPLMIAGGDDDPIYDNTLARDANGLPMLPATSIAGLLRARLVRAGWDTAKVDGWFGHQTRTSAARSAVTVTDGLFHWSDGVPRDGLVLGDDRTGLETDPICKLARSAAPILRDHVRLNGRGVVDGAGKFNRVAVPKGARFTFELRCPDEQVVRTLAALIRDGLWMGGATRSGYGRLICRKAGLETIRRETDEGWQRYCAFAAADLAHSPLHLAEVTFVRPSADWGIEGRIEGPLLIGGPPPEGTKINRAPYREQFIEWSAGAATLTSRHVLPGSAVKGPLRHRTQFHLRAAGLDPTAADAVVKGLFGQASDKTQGRAGKLRFRDVPLPDPKVHTVTHVGLDRFTGGARDSVLFTDQMLWSPELCIGIDETEALDPTEAQAFAQALDDMAKGLCGLGAEWGEGAGVFALGARVTRPEGVANAA